MTPAGVLLGLVLGLLLGGLLGAALARRLRSRPAVLPAPGADRGVPTSVEVIEALPVAVAVLAGDDRVVLANRRAVELGVVRAQRLLVPELRRLAHDVRRTGLPQEVEVEPARTRMLRLPEAVRVRVARVDDVAGHVALLVEDVTESRRVEAVRRDFVANVSHELKTPVGGMSLLAEALVDAANDPAAVRRFGGRLQKEAGLPEDALREVGEQPPDGFPTYSGAPLLSFYDPTLADPASRFSYPPFWTNLLRLVLSMALLLIFVLPIVALQKLRSDLRHREIIRVFPIFTVQRPKGSGGLELLQVVLKKRGGLMNPGSRPGS